MVAHAACQSCRSKVESVLWSAKKPASGITIVTTLTPSRLEQLESQCRTYKGPISAAAYVELWDTSKEPKLSTDQQEYLAAVKASLKAFHEK
jgi:hypothetical protein